MLPKHNDKINLLNFTQNINRSQVLLSTYEVFRMQCHFLYKNKMNIYLHFNKFPFEVSICTTIFSFFYINLFFKMSWQISSLSLL